jgi:tetratricopeptide (TPR) repeat protein/transglutaminase-like putative cysteine protease
MKSAPSLLRSALLFCIASLVLHCCPPSPAQTPAKTPSPAKPQVVTVPVKIVSTPDYSGEASVFESATRVYTYAADGTGSRQLTGVIRVQTEAAVKDLSVLDFAFASGSEHVEIDYVRVRRADGSVQATPATDAQEQPAPVTREAPFYSDLKQEQIPIRSLRVGDHLEYSIRFVRTRAEAPGHFWGDETFASPLSGQVVLSEILEIRLPATSYIQVWSPHFEPTLTTDAGQRVYHWNSSQLVPVAGKDKSALLKLEKYPDLSGDDASLPDVAWTNFHTWQEVGAWYRSLEGSRTEPDDDIRAKVTQLIAGKSTPEDKARAVYSFVGLQVRYIGVAFGIGRYQPHQAADILSNQYGDCKDKNTLLTSMLAATGITADSVLIGSGIKFNEEVPSPGAFNHVITLAHVDNQPVWLDSTAEVAPYRMLMPNIRGKRALVIPLSGDAHLDTTPKDSPFPFEQHFDAIGTLDDKGTSHSKITLDLRGDEEIEFRQAVRSVSPAQWDELMQRISYAMNYAGKVTNAEFSRPEDTATPFHVTYDYEREKAGDWDNLRIIPQLPPIALGDADEKDPPVTPIELGSPGAQIAHSIMTLPAGWTAELPDPIHVKTPFATFDKTYKFDHGAVIVDRRFVILQQKIPASDWKAYHQWYEDAGLDGETYIPLSRPGGSPASGAHNDAAAASLIQEAFADFKDKQFKQGEQKLNAAKKINPQQPHLWAGYATLALMNGKSKDAVEDFQRELHDHPDETQVYIALADIQQRMHKPTDAIATLQQELTRNPADESAALALSSLLVAQKDYPGDEQAMRSAVTASPDSIPLKLALARALNLTGKSSEGRPIFEDILAKSTDPLTLNNAAYELADHAQDLPLAEKSARRALDILDEASNAGETGTAAFRRTSLLVNTWDTYGWILFQEGKTDAALPWLRGAWRNSLDLEPGYHLGMVLEKLNKTDQALATYQLAVMADPSATNPTVHDSIQARIDALKQSGARADGATGSLQTERTYTVPRPIDTPNFWAEVEIQLTTAGTQDVRYTSNNDTAPPALLPIIKGRDLKLQLPADTHAHLFRHGVISCHGGPTCDLVLTTSNDIPTQ